MCIRDRVSTQSTGPLNCAMKAFTLVVALFVLGLLAACDAKVWHAILVFNGEQAGTTSSHTGVGTVFYESSTQELTVHITHSLSSSLAAAQINSASGSTLLSFYDRPRASKGTIVGSGNPLPISALYHKSNIPLSVACALITGQSNFALRTTGSSTGDIRAIVPVANQNCTAWFGSEQPASQGCFEVPKQVLNVNFAGMFNTPVTVVADASAPAPTLPSPQPTSAPPPDFGLPVFTYVGARPQSPFDQQPPISNPVIPLGRPGENCYPYC
eukprot:TRINITY_DN1715_c0_g1_i1.p1 TRINITY_DN1715_c0_g1~~TRINITY_DN1715_c0_g1_i1.p1  ORF type:complete len:270 (+),score=76.64 TRINITY_DN1715_c0_g1_i1:25-834(+)